MEILTNEEKTTLQLALDYLHKNITASIDYEDFHDFSKGIKGASVDYFPESADELLIEMGYKVIEQPIDTKEEEELIHKGDYDRLPESEKLLYKVQYQEWKSGWVDCNDKPYEIVGHVRVMYRLISSIVSTPLQSDSVEMDIIDRYYFETQSMYHDHNITTALKKFAQWQQSNSRQEVVIKQIKDVIADLVNADMKKSANDLRNILNQLTNGK